MRISIISDLHANLEALSALPRDYDELWVLGDLVNYGPNPAEIIDFVRSHASMIIRGNHDHSVEFVLKELVPKSRHVVAKLQPGRDGCDGAGLRCPERA